MVSRLIILLLLMSLLGVFALDALLPSFPALATHFEVGTSSIAYSISLFTLGVALSQCLIGPLSDRLGRKCLLLAGLAVAIAGALGCLVAPNYPSFLVFRLVQAIGCGCFVLSQALVQDMFKGQQRNRMRILLTSASGVFISLSPLAGSVLQQLFGWTGSFALFIGLTVIVVLLSRSLLQEAPIPQRPYNIFHSYRLLLGDRCFLGYSTLAALAFTCHFAFIVVSPLLFMDRLGLSDYTFSLVFIGYGAAYVTGGLIASRVNGKLSAHAQIALGLALIGGAGMLLVIWLALAGLSVASILLPMVICTAGTTLTRPAATTCALERHPERAGAAAALSNTLLFATGGVASALVAVAEATLPMSLAAGFIGMSLCGGLLLIGLSRSQPLIA